MIKYYIALLIIPFTNSLFCQPVFQSDLSTWSSGVPDDWMGTKTSISSIDVHELTDGVVYGSSYCSLINTTSSHKRFTTKAVPVIADSTYIIEIWVSAEQGEIRTNIFDITNSNSGPSGNGYGQYNPYIDLSSISGNTNNQVLISQSVTIPSDCDSVEFILSIRNTDLSTSSSSPPLGILIDSVSISTTISDPTNPNTELSASVYDVQFNRNLNNESYYIDSGNVFSGGIVSYVRDDGRFYISSGSGPWSGIYVYDNIENVSVGDSVTFSAQVDEYNGLTEFKNLSNLIVVSQSNNINVNSCSTINANSEQYEGCLIKVIGDCSSETNQYGEWEINDGSGSVIVDDFNLPNSFSPTLGTPYILTGIVDYFYQFKIQPRDIYDIEVSSGIINLVDRFSFFPNPSSNNTINLEINKNDFLRIFNLRGELLNTIRIVKGLNTINLNFLSNGVYLLKVNNEFQKLIINK
jgi:hypothetical protein